MKKRLAIPMGSYTLIPTNKDGVFIKVDNEFSHLDKVLWCVDNTGYARNQNTRMHTIIIGKPEKGKVTDHINRDRLDNRRVNLRHVTHGANNLNRKKKSGASSKYKGVTRYITRQGHIRFRAWVSKKGKLIGNRDFKNEVDAARYRDRLATDIHGEHADLNFARVYNG